MRLLQAKNLELQFFPNDHQVPKYATLSHTWEEEEISFQDIQGYNVDTIPPPVAAKAGFKKVEACCTQALEDGLEYVWIDTCSIDKTSSSELQEAINSMYRWYKQSSVCYVYLADVPGSLNKEFQMRYFQKSRWFTRGWTLQELIAPATLVFFDNQWHLDGARAYFGTKKELSVEIASITNIEAAALEGSRPLQSFSIAKRMAWAARRQTTRLEDKAYCLMGIFDVNMPMLYGEGEKAFRRLQEEILRTSDDESLFAWGQFVSPGEVVPPTLP